MALAVSLIGKAALPAPHSGTFYQVWSYRVDPSGPGELPQGQRVALALPSELEIRDPDLYPEVPQLAGMFLQRQESNPRQYVGRMISGGGALTISFVAPAAATTREVFLVRAPSTQAWVSLPFVTPTSGGPPSHVQVLPVPVPGPPVFNGRPVTDFAGALPYASELFGIYQPLAGWFGAQTMAWASSTAGEREPRLRREAFFGEAARNLDDEALAALAQLQAGAIQGVLSPVGVVNLFRQYFFEFDTFLGPPAGHLWLSPGGTVEVVETSTRRTLVEKVSEQFQETSRKSEESLTQQDDVADAVKEENANDTKLGVSATGGVNAGIYHADASASFSLQNTVKRASEQTHKQTRTQSAKVTSEIKRNFKTTFKTVTETTDTSSRRYVVQNTTDELVNYELRRKLRKVGVQLQHIGARLSWQVYFDGPGRELGLGDMVHVVAAPDLTAVPPPEQLPMPADKQIPFHGEIPFIQRHGGDDDTENTYTTNPNDIDSGIHVPDVGQDNIIIFRFDFALPTPPEGYVYSRLDTLDFHGATVQYTIDAPQLGMSANPDPVARNFRIRLTRANFQGQRKMPFDAVFTCTPTEAAKQAVTEANNAAKAAHAERIAQLQREAYGNAVRERLRLVSSMRPRPAEDLRKEERHTVFARLIRTLSLGEDPHLGAELIRQFFDVDEMLYFVAPDFWRPDVMPPPPSQNSVGKYPVPPPSWATGQSGELAGQTVAGWYAHTDSYKRTEGSGPVADEWRVNYLITEETQPAPLGSSLGWLIQVDGDERRNEFLNAAWAKAVLPIRPGHEVDALKWLADVEGQAALGLDYPFQDGVDPPEYAGKKVGQVLELVAAELQAANTNLANTLATDKVFETGFDPLAGGFRPAEPYQVFDQWVEVLPTDQIAAVAVKYDPKTGQQI